MEELCLTRRTSGDQIIEGIYTEGQNVINMVNKEGLFTVLPYIGECKGVSVETSRWLTQKKQKKMFLCMVSSSVIFLTTGYCASYRVQNKHTNKTALGRLMEGKKSSEDYRQHLWLRKPMEVRCLF